MGIDQLDRSERTIRLLLKLDLNARALPPLPLPPLRQLSLEDRRDGAMPPSSRNHGGRPRRPACSEACRGTSWRRCARETPQPRPKTDRSRRCSDRSPSSSRSAWPPPCSAAASARSGWTRRRSMRSPWPTPVRYAAAAAAFQRGRGAGAGAGPAARVNGGCAGGDQGGARWVLRVVYGQLRSVC